jgi:hypothetical protein
MMVKFKKTFSVTKSCPKQAQGNIYVMSCLHVWKQNVCLGRTVSACVLAEPYKWLAPFEISPPLSKKNRDVTTHCFIHREVLVSKALGDEMKKVFSDATKMINFIKQRPVHSNMFKKLP